MGSGQAVTHHLEPPLLDELAQSLAAVLVASCQTADPEHLNSCMATLGTPHSDAVPHQLMLFPAGRLIVDEAKGTWGMRRKAEAQLKLQCELLSHLRESTVSFTLGLQLNSIEDFQVQCSSLIQALDRAEPHCTDNTYLLDDVKTTLRTFAAEVLSPDRVYGPQDTVHLVGVFRALGSDSRRVFGDPRFVICADFLNLRPELASFTNNHSDEAAMTLYSTAMKVASARGLDELVGVGAQELFGTKVKELLSSSPAVVVREKACSRARPAVAKCIQQLGELFPSGDLSPEMDTYGDKCDDLIKELMHTRSLVHKLGDDRCAGQLDVFFHIRNVMQACYQLSAARSGFDNKVDR
jgi:hypothetical protein